MDNTKVAEKIKKLRQQAKDKSLPQDVRNQMLDNANMLEEKAAKSAGVKMAVGGMAQRQTSAGTSTRPSSNSVNGIGNAMALNRHMREKEISSQQATPKSPNEQYQAHIAKINQQKRTSQLAKYAKQSQQGKLSDRDIKLANKLSRQIDGADQQRISKLKPYQPKVVDRPPVAGPDARAEFNVKQAELTNQAPMAKSPAAFAKGGVVKAACGASVPPAQKRK